jgi:signal transduction histidine kinase
MPRGMSQTAGTPGRSVVVAFSVASLLALAGAVYSYRSDVEQVRAALKDRVLQLAEVYAVALGQHLQVMASGLARSADGGDLALGPGALFNAGLARLDANGRVVEGTLSGTHQATLAAWARALPPDPRAHLRVFPDGVLAMAWPRVQEGRVTGVLVGVADTVAEPLPGGRAVGDGTSLVVMDQDGTLLVPPVPPAWAARPDFPARVEELLREPSGRGLHLSDEPRLAAARRIEGTSLRLVLVKDEEPLVAPMRRRFLVQFLVLAVAQTAAFLLLSFFVRQTIARTLDAERRAAEAEKLASLGTAASLIAHEVKNSLNGLNAASALLPGDVPELQLPVKTVRAQVDRLKHLASSLLQFSRPHPAQPVQSQLAPLVRETLEALRALPEADEVALETHVDPQVHARCDPLLLATALDNLVRNAIEAAVAAKDLGRIARPHVRVELGAAAGQARIDVEDNAGGPPEGFQPFLPFVTTKPRGIGLGLAMARQAVEAQGGQLSFERTAAGSRFSVQLPLAPTEARA